MKEEKQKEISEKQKLEQQEKDIRKRRYESLVNQHKVSMRKRK